MKLVISPEPAPWLGPLLDSLGGEEVTVIAPWSLPGRPPDFLPQRLRAAWSRRTLEVRSKVSVPGWSVLESLWRRIGTTGALSSKLVLRQALDVVLAWWLPKTVTHLFAPSLCALRTFAAAPHAEKVLLEDLPGLRQLHADLDLAHRALPSCAILHNFRAPDSAVVRQEQEAVLATRVLTQGHFARGRLIRLGVAREKLGALPSPRLETPFHFDPGARAVYFAGTTAVRAGFEVALAAVDQVPGVTLCARRGEASFGPSLAHPRLRLLGSGEVPTVRAVLAPAWVECRPPEIEVAARAEVPVLGTRRALGWVEPSRRVTEVIPGNVQAIIRWLRASQKNFPPRSDASAS